MNPKENERTYPYWVKLSYETKENNKIVWTKTNTVSPIYVDERRYVNIDSICGVSLSLLQLLNSKETAVIYCNICPGKKKNVMTISNLLSILTRLVSNIDYLSRLNLLKIQDKEVNFVIP